MKIDHDNIADNEPEYHSLYPYSYCTSQDIDYYIREGKYVAPTQYAIGAFLFTYLLFELPSEVWGLFLYVKQVWLNFCLHFGDQHTYVNKSQHYICSSQTVIMSLQKTWIKQLNWYGFIFLTTLLLLLELIWWTDFQ